MSAMERTTYRRSLGSNAWAFDEPRRDPQPAPYTSGPSTDFSSDDSIPLFLSDLQGQPDPRELAPFAASQRTSILTRVVAGGLVVSAFAILVAVLNSDVTRVLIDKQGIHGRRVLIDSEQDARPTGGASRDQSATQAASNQPASATNTEPRGYRKRLSTPRCRIRSRPHVQGMKPLRRRKRSMPKRWQR